MEEKNKGFLDGLLNEAKAITKTIFKETGKTYQSFKANMDIVSLKKRRRERLADLGYKVFTFVREGKLKVPGVEYIISELKALDFQIKLKEEDLIETASASPTGAREPEIKEEKKETSPVKEKKEAQPKEAPKKAEKDEIKTVKLDEKTVLEEAQKAEPEELPKSEEKPFEEVATPETADPLETLSQIKGVGAKTAQALIDAGYTTIKKIAGADAKKLGEALDKSEKVVQKYIDGAKDFLK